MGKNYECKRCGYECIQKETMRRHIYKKTKCQPIYKVIFNDKDLEILSLTKKYKEKISTNKEHLYCKTCDIYFNKKYSLNRHLANNVCYKNMIAKNNKKQNNICLIKFNENWNIDNISLSIKYDLLYNKNQYCNVFDMILNEQKNHNIYTKNGNEFYVYKKTNFQKIEECELFVSIMYKIYIFLCYFYNELIKDNYYITQKEILDICRDNIEKDYKKYFYNNDNFREIMNEELKNIIRNAIKNKYSYNNDQNCSIFEIIGY